MKLGSYLVKESVDVPFYQMMQMIVSNCQPFLKEVVKGGFNDTFLYSGRSERKYFIDKPIRKNRKPKDTNPVISNDLDKAFAKKFGYPARSNSMFCTGRVVTSMTYGEPYIIFPKGNYKFIWSKDVDDMYNYIADNMNAPTLYSNKDRDINISIKNAMKQDAMIDFKKSYKPGTKPYGDYQRDEFETYFEKWSVGKRDKYQEQYDQKVDHLVGMYSDKDIRAAIKSGNEVMITTNEYYGVSAKHGGRYTLDEWFIRFGSKMPSEEEARKFWRERGSQWNYSMLGI